MATSNAPWRCAWCMRLNKSKANRCGACDVLWHRCIDPTYVHGGHARKGTYTDWTKDWEDEEYWNRGGNASRHVSSSRSASARADKHAKHAKGKTNKNRSKANKKTSAPPLEPPWNAGHDVHAPSVPSASREEVQKAEDKYNQLVSKLQNAKDEEEMRQIVAESNRGTASSKSMHQAVTKLDQARDKYKGAKKARQNLHNNWNAYLNESIKRWQKFAEEFAEKDQVLESEVDSTLEKLQAARQHLDEVKEQHSKMDAHFLSNSVDLVSDMEEETLKEETSATIKEGITKLLAGLENAKVSQKDEETIEESAPKKAKVGDGGGAGSRALTAFGGPSK